MSEYYGTDNELYNFIKSKKHIDWFLLYENSISLLVAANDDNYPNFLLVEDRSVNVDASYIAKCETIVLSLAKQLNVCAFWLKYTQDVCITSDTIVSIKTCDETSWSETQECPLRTLANIVNDKTGLQTTVSEIPKQVSKAYNDKPSSNFHEWQRDYWISCGYIVDIDLIRTGWANQISHIYELKRSHDAIEKWVPYRDDTKNYLVIAHICDKIGAKFIVVYNKMGNIDILKLFDVYHRVGSKYNEHTLLIRLVGIENPHSFIGSKTTVLYNKQMLSIETII